MQSQQIKIEIELTETELLAIENFISRSSFATFRTLAKDIDDIYQIQNPVLKVLRQVRDTGIDRY